MFASKKLDPTDCSSRAQLDRLCGGKQRHCLCGRKFRSRLCGGKPSPRGRGTVGRRDKKDVGPFL